MILCHGRIRRYLGIDPREVVASHSKGMETFPASPERSWPGSTPRVEPSSRIR